MQTILVCDDDKQIVEAISIYLTGEGFNVLKAYDGYDVLEIMEQHRVDLLIIDVMMPGLDGVHTVLKIRETSSIPIIMLSAKGEDNDKILGLNVGADDYLTKPFSTSELLARIRVACRHLHAQTTAETTEIYSVRGLSLDTAKRLVYLDGKELHMTPMEYKLLYFLFRNIGKVLTTGAIIERSMDIDD
jgi:DNA-binding response OmpR family regulator